MGRAILRAVSRLVLPRHSRDATVAPSPAEAFLCTKQQEHHWNTASSNTLWFCWRNRSKWEFVAPIILSHCSTWCSGQNILFYCCCVLNVYKYCQCPCLWFIQFLQHMPDDINSPDWINRIIYPFRSRHRFSVFTKMRYWFPLFVVQLFSLSFSSLTSFYSNKLLLCKVGITLIKTPCPKMFNFLTQDSP